MGDFPLYVSLIAGCADRASRGEVISQSEIAVPDEETARSVSDLRQKSSTCDEEQAFLAYFDLLERIRLSLLQQGSQ